MRKFTLPFNGESFVKPFVCGLYRFAISGSSMNSKVLYPMKHVFVLNIELIIYGSCNK